MAYPRYRRVNTDGKSLYKTETRLAAAALLPGTFAVINASDAFAQSTAATGRMYVVDVGYHQGPFFQTLEAATRTVSSRPSSR